MESFNVLVNKMAALPSPLSEDWWPEFATLLKIMVDEYPDTKPRVARLLAMIEEESQDGEWAESFQHDPQSVLSSCLVTEEYQPCQ